MPFFLIKISPAKWYAHDGVSWLKPGELQADALWDLRVSTNVISAWHIEDSKSNLSRVVAALAGKRNVLGEFGYALVNQQFVSGLNIKTERTPGDAIDELANSSWHYNLIELTVSKIVGLVNEMGKTENRGRFLEVKVKEFLEQSVRSGWIKLQSLDLNIKKKLDPRLSDKSG